MTTEEDRASRALGESMQQGYNERKSLLTFYATYAKSFDDL